jgi:hypothetical protein
MHIPAHVPAKDQSRFRNRKGILSQNVLAACTFDLQFIFIYPGWEGSVTDSRILRAVLDDPDQNFPQIPEGLITPTIFVSSNYYSYITFYISFLNLTDDFIFQANIILLTLDIQIWKDLLLHIMELGTTFMNIEVPISYLELQRSCSITDTLI